MEERSMISARSIFLSVCVMVSFLALAAYAAPDGNVSGSYSISAPTAAGDDVQVTISLSISNNTSADIKNAAISLHDPLAARMTYGSLNGLALPAGAATHVSGSFKVPRQLYDSWQKGSSPAMSVSFNDADGKAVRMFIEF